MRGLLLLGALLVVLLAAIAWKLYSDEEPAPLGDVGPSTGVVMLGVGAEPGGEPAAPPAQPPPTASSPPPAAGNAQAAEASTGQTQTERAEAAYRSPPPEEPPATQEPTVAGAVHVVQQGENLYRIVLAAYGKWSEEIADRIVEVNELSNADDLPTGKSLRLPVVEGFPAPKGG